MVEVRARHYYGRLARIGGSSSVERMFTFLYGSESSTRHNMLTPVAVLAVDGVSANDAGDGRPASAIWILLCIRFTHTLPHLRLPVP